MAVLISESWLKPVRRVSLRRRFCPRSLFACCTTRVAALTSTMFISSIVPQVHSSAPTRQYHRGRLSSTRAKVLTRRTALAPPRSPSLSHTTTSLSKRVRSLWTLKKSTCSQCVPSPPLLSAAPTTAAARLFLSLSRSLPHARRPSLHTHPHTLTTTADHTTLGRSALPCE